jgi:hypothetical protein
VPREKSFITFPPEHERLIDEKLTTFAKAVEAEDASTAREEFVKYVAAGNYVPSIKISKALDFFEKQKVTMLKKRFFLCQGQKYAGLFDTKMPVQCVYL